jgi:putative phage-type endonuclease
VKIIDCVQGSPEWHTARAGKVTASCIADVMAKIKTGEAAARRDYRATIVSEILTGTAQGSTYQSTEMLWGTEQEPFARSAYEVATGTLVDQVGFVLHPSIERAGMSPDGLVGSSGLVEIKAPKTATHLQYLLDGSVPAQYQPQMLFQMACAEAEYCDFVSFDPRLSPELQLFVVRFNRDEKRIKEMEAEVEKFLAEVDSMLARLNGLGLRKAA